MIPRSLTRPHRSPALLFCRYVASLGEQPTISDDAPIKRRRQRLRTISTLNPNLLKPTDRVFIYPLQQQFFVTCKSSPAAPAMVSYYRIPGSRPNIMMPFPADSTGGFLYYHRPPLAAPLEGSIRLRLTPEDDPMGFAKGRDLVLPTGVVWELNLPQIANNKALGAFRDQLLHEQLVTDTQLARCRALFDGKGITPALTLFRLEQEFPVDFARSINLVIVGERLHSLALTTVFTATVNGRQVFPWTGTALVRFEPSPIPEFAARRIVHMRIVKIVTPARLALPLPLSPESATTSPTDVDDPADQLELANTDPDSPGTIEPDANVKRPKLRMFEPLEGYLLGVSRRGKGVYPWACDLDRGTQRARALKVLWDASGLA
ncbi:hypothetical protein DFH06DRAFT_1159972 [Mycena polygramma]|nr:hypothetical protein DFH06DRAFT_1159972 [Mycena polygramma]